MIDPPQDRPEEPTAVTPHGGIRGGESQQWLSYPTDPPVRFGGRGDRTQSVLPTPIMTTMGTGLRRCDKIAATRSPMIGLCEDCNNQGNWGMRTILRAR